jgi:hypothetical protein
MALVVAGKHTGTGRSYAREVCILPVMAMASMLLL